MRGALARAHRLVEASEGIAGPAGREIRMARAAAAAAPPTRARMGQGYYEPLASMIAGEVPKVGWKSKEAYEAFESEILTIQRAAAAMLERWKRMLRTPRKWTARRECLRERARVVLWA